MKSWRLGPRIIGFACLFAFIGAGFEHSVANMYFVPYALLVKRDHAFVASLAKPTDLSRLTWGRFLWANLVPVTIGNVLGGALLVGAVYWFVYLRAGRSGERAPAAAIRTPGR